MRPTTRQRHLLPRIRSALDDTPVVFLQGPRQCGKSTLARELGEREGLGRTYLTLDDGAVFAAARGDADAFVAGLPSRVTLDEIQRAPDLFRAIKRSVDEHRAPGRFLLTGSADALALPNLSESLAGRVEILTLLPFSQGELTGHVEGFVDECFAPSWTAGTTERPLQRVGWNDLVRSITRGGYPEVLERPDEQRRAAWFDAYVTTILQRDVRDIASISQLGELPKLLRLAATRLMGLLNFADLARDAGLSRTTLQRYWALLEATFLVSTLPAYSENLGSRLVKAPKVSFNDTGLASYLLGSSEERLLRDSLMAGPLLEAWVVGELRKQAAWSRTGPTFYHFRTHTQREVDVVMEDRSGELVGIEVKKAQSLKPSHFAGLEHLSTALGRRFRRGVLLYLGQDRVAFGKELWAVPVGAVWQW